MKKKVGQAQLLIGQKKSWMWACSRLWDTCGMCDQREVWHFTCSFRWHFDKLQGLKNLKPSQFNMWCLQNCTVLLLSSKVNKISKVICFSKNDLFSFYKLTTPCGFLSLGNSKMLVFEDPWHCSFWMPPKDHLRSCIYILKKCIPHLENGNRCLFDDWQ